MRQLLVKIAIKLGVYKWCVDLDTNLREKRIARAFRKYGLETMRRADEVVSGFGGHLVLYFGTLLGAIREHGFIPHDNDLDLAIPIEDRLEDFVEIMERNGFSHFQQTYIPSLNRIIEDRFTYKGCQMDIFYLYSDREDGKTYSYIARRHETKEWREANRTDGFPVDVWPTEKCEFKRTDFLGMQLYIPAKAHEWMRDIYGDDYMTPIKAWDVKKQKKTLMEHTDLRAFRR